MKWKAAEESHRMLGILPIIAEYSLRTSEPDTILVGRYGYIWFHSENKYMVVVDSPIIATRHLGLKGPDKIQKGEEVHKLVDEEEARKWVKILKVPNSRPSQIKLMSNR